MNFSKRLERLLYDLYLSVYYWLEAIVKYCIPHRFYSKDLSNETVLITGAASGIGRELALELAPQVKTLILWDMNENGLKESLTLIQDKCKECDCLAFKVDITNRVEVYKTAELVRKSFIGQSVSMVINNAGVVSGKNFLDLNDEDILKSFDVNVLSNFWINKAFLPDMIAQNHGHIVTMASVASFFGVPKLTDYSSSKSAVYMLHETLACELRSLGIKGIKFTAICPFLVNTKMFQGAYSPLLGTLESDYVVDKIIQAIKIEQFILAMPKIIYFFLWMKQLVPVASGYFMLRLSGFIDLMSNFTQKNAPQSNGINRKIR